MFSPEERGSLRSDLLERAAADKRISGTAITGSAAAECEDEWSDIDLAFGVAGSADVPNVLSDWTAYMYNSHRALHHVDIKAGAWLYRVFLLSSTLQVDLAFVPAAEFRALTPAFRLVSGSANEARHVPPPSPESLIGLGWLYALHARSSIARGRLWQAEYMISGVRDHALALACLRHGLPAVHGRGLDRLPCKVRAQFEPALVRELSTSELSRAFQAAVEGLLSEIGYTDQELSARLQSTLGALARRNSA